MSKMKSFGFFILIAWLGFAHSVEFEKQNTLHWSRESVVLSPDRAWQVEVHPNFESEENQSPVALRNLTSGEVVTLLLLDRRAKLFWSADSNNLLFLDQPTADNYRVLLFRDINKGVFDQQDSAYIDKEIKRIIAEKYGENRHLNFYLPEVLFWKKNRLTFSISGTTSPEEGQLREYCFGVVLSIDQKKIVAVLSKKEIGKKFPNYKCRIFP